MWQNDGLQPLEATNFYQKIGTTKSNETGSGQFATIVVHQISQMKQAEA